MSETKIGRPTKYNPTLLPLIKRAANMGMTNVEIAELIGVNPDTLNSWQAIHEELHAAMRIGKEGPNQRVVASLFKSAVGYTIQVKKGRINKDGDVVEWEEDLHVPANVTAQIFFLKNRMNDEWNDRNGQGGSQTFADYTDAQLAALVREKAAKLVITKATDNVLEGAVVAERPVKNVTPKKD